MPSSHEDIPTSSAVVSTKEDIPTSSVVVSTKEDTHLFVCSDQPVSMCEINGLRNSLKNLEILLDNIEKRVNSSQVQHSPVYDRDFINDQKLFQSLLKSFKSETNETKDQTYDNKEKESSSNSMTEILNQL
jgi:hypothetical protein